MEWKWDNDSFTRGAGLPISVDLRLVEQMSIPLDHNKAFTGDELKTTVEAIVSRGRPGRRILIHGAPGMGKDTLAVQAVRHRLVEAKEPGFELQGWLQGSTSSAHRRQLTRLFEVHRPEELPHESLNAKDDEKLALIRGWLTRNSNWLIVVEDATVDSMESIRDYLNGDGTRGTLLITSQVGPQVFQENIGCAVELGPWSLADRAL